MKFVVNESCIGCGSCAAACPEVFSLGSDGVAKAIKKDVPAAPESAAMDAKEGCPMGAIEEK